MGQGDREGSGATVTEGTTVAAAAADVGRHPSSISLIAVSKSHPASAASAALSAGHRVFAENRVQEAQNKWLSLRASYPDATVHLIGPLQSNKAKEAVALFDVIESVDREKIAAELAKEMRRQDRLWQTYRTRHPDAALAFNPLSGLRIEDVLSADIIAALEGPAR